MGAKKIMHEDIHLNCNNFLTNNICDPRIIDKFKLKKVKEGTTAPRILTSDFEWADKICSGCKNFIPKNK